MPRYFVHYRGSKVILDADGIDRPDDEAACKEALRVARELISRYDDVISKSFSVWVTDQPDGTGRVVYEGHFDVV